MAVNTSINFPNLTSKATPTTSDSIELSDQAAGGIPKQATILSLPALNVQQVTQYSKNLYSLFSCSLPGMIGGTQSDSQTQSMGTLLNSNVVFVPFYVSTSWATSSLSIVVKTGLAASTTTLGIYASTPSDGTTFANMPTGSALSAGSVATATSNAFATATVSTTLSANTLYWAAIQCSSAVTLAIAVGPLTAGPTMYKSITGTTLRNNLLLYPNTYSAGTLPTLTQSSITSATITPYCPIINGI